MKEKNKQKLFFMNKYACVPILKNKGVKMGVQQVFL